ncbi:MAG TPA: hypothetical protein VKV95_13450 [Terriglobia bacterium]|nr:hypothetical protein [Terriglobia bacterium]
MDNPVDYSNTKSLLAPRSINRAANKASALEKTHSYIFKRASADLGRPSRRSPATPLMMNPTAAWRLLCAKTGGGIALATFYRWIRDGRVCTIRLGKKILVPRHLLDVVIEKCLKGEELL